MATFQAGSGSVSGTITASTSGTLLITPTGDFDGSIDDVSVRKINEDGSYGPEIIINGGFNGSADNWTLETGWTYQGESGGGLPNYLPSILTAVSRVSQNLPFPQFVCGGVESQTGPALFKKSDTYTFSLWRSRVFQVGQYFKINAIRFSIVPELDNGMEILPVLRIDNESVASIGTLINSDNFSENSIILTPDNFDNGTKGTSNFYLEFQFTGTALASILLPISIEIETEDTV